MHNQSSSLDQSNEFMPRTQQAPPQDPLFDQFVQACFKNPDFEKSMRQFYYSQQQGSQVQSQPSARDNVHEQHSRADFRDEEVEQERGAMKKEKRLPANPLLKYASHEPKAVTPKVEKIQEESKPAFDDVPIKSRYIEEVQKMGESAVVDLHSLKENQSVNISESNLYREMDQRPIKSMKPEKFNEQYREPNPLQMYQPKPKQVKRKQPEFQDDDRPLTGTGKNFKQMLKEQLPGLSLEPDQAEEEHEQMSRKGSTRQFLKRGSRQHLSSALSRGKPPKQHTQQDDINKSGLSKRDLTPRNNRSVSQNRVLAKRSDDKGNSRAHANSNASELSQSRKVAPSKPPLARDTGKKKDVAGVKHKQQAISPSNSQVKKGKNVFNDDSQSSSSESEPDPQPVFEPKKTTPISSMPTKNSSRPNVFRDEPEMEEVIEGVYLTSDQLDEIVRKYGRAKPVPLETESQKIKNLRAKYTDLCALVEEEKAQMKAQLDRQREQFERHKSEQIQKMKNERRVWERQAKSSAGGAALQKDREELEHQRQALEKEREEFKKKDKNSKIIIDKYKKEVEQLKTKIDRLEVQKETLSHKASQNRFSNEEPALDSKKTVAQTAKPKVQQIDKNQEESSPLFGKNSKKDLKVGAKTKPKYEYVEDQPVVVNKSQAKKESNRWEPRFDDSSSGEDDYEHNQGDDYSQQKQDRQVQSLADLLRDDLSIRMVTQKMVKTLFHFRNHPDFLHFKAMKEAPERKMVNTTRNNRNNFTANTYSDGTKQMLYDNGTVKESSDRGYSIVYFKNGDIKQTLADKTILYFFSEKDVDQITLPNNVNIFRFDNNQVEFHFPNKNVEIRHPDGTIKVIGQPLYR